MASQEPQQPDYPPPPPVQAMDPASLPAQPSGASAPVQPTTDDTHPSASGPPTFFDASAPLQTGSADNGLATATPHAQPDGAVVLPVPPPRRVTTDFSDDDPSDPSHYVRDPHTLVAYLVTFPKPSLKDEAAAQSIPARFLIYTPPPPPIGAPEAGEKEDRVRKIQRKWQDEVRAAKTSDAKVTSWKGVKSRATKGIDWAMGQTKSSSLEFLNRVPKGNAAQSTDAHAEDGHEEGHETHKTVGLEEMVLVHPSSMHGTQEQIREEFVNSMLRSKSKAQRDAVIATGLIPVTFAIDVLATLVWPFGGLVEIDTVWAVANVRGAKTARSVTKRLNSSTPDSKDQLSPQTGGALGKLSSLVGRKGSTGSGTEEHKLRLTFVPSARVNILDKYLAGHCHHRDAKLFYSPGVLPTETDVVNAIGWSPHQTAGETKNWEDEQWELHEVKDDVKNVMSKGAREWDKWIKAYEKDPEKALKK